MVFRFSFDIVSYLGVACDLFCEIFMILVVSACGFIFLFDSHIDGKDSLPTFLRDNNFPLFCVKNFHVLIF